MKSLRPPLSVTVSGSVFVSGCRQTTTFKKNPTTNIIITLHARCVSQIHTIYFRYPSGNEPIENVWKEEAVPIKAQMINGQTFCLSCSKWTNHICYCQVATAQGFLLVLGVTLAMRHCTMTSHDAAWYLTKILPKTVGSKAKKHLFHQEKSSVGLVCFSFIVKIPCSSDKPAAPF